MKFTDGNWFIKKGVRMIHPVEVYESNLTSDALTIYASSRHMTERGGGLNQPLMEIRYSSPAPDIIRVQIFHYKGAQDRGPHFEIQSSEHTEIITNETETEISLRSGNLAVNVKKQQPWSVNFAYDGRVLTKSIARSTAHITTADECVYLREQLELGVGECIYGLGERFSALVKNGQSIDIWNDDGGTGSELAYKNIPFYVTNRGYGVFVNHPEQVSFEVATERVTKVQFSVPGECLDYYIIGGKTLKHVLGNYTYLTGKPALPPAWSFGLWLSTSFTTNYDEQTVTHFVNGMAERGIPLRVFHFDCFWMKGLHWCDFTWDDEVFPEPAMMLQRMKQKGLNICVWINPYIAQQSSLFAEGKEHGYFLKQANGDVWQRDEWQPGMAIVDFTNPAACAWYASKLQSLVAMGVDSFKTDFGERIPTDVVYFDGSDPFKMHNYYAFLYNKVVFDVLEREKGRGNAVVFARAATVGSQKFPVHWGGDSNATYESMAESLRGGLSFGLGGFGFWSHDIGGFENSSTPDVYKRWIAFGMLSSHSRLHGSGSYRVPWLYDEEAVNVLNFFTRQKCRLMPYLYATAKQAAESGLPLMRAMILEFEHDPACDYLERQYLLGDALLIAPVLSENGSVSFYLPQGTWTNFLTGEQVTGGIWRHEQHGYLSLPIYARNNTIVALGQQETRPDYDYADGVDLHVFALQPEGQATAQVYNQHGQRELSVLAKRHGQIITVHTEGVDKSWNVILRNISGLASVQGATYEQTEQGIRLTPHTGVNTLEITLSV